MCVLIFTTNLSVTFLILGRTERDVIQMYIGLHVKDPSFFSYFNESLIFSPDFRKIFKYQIWWMFVQWQPKLFCADGQTDRHDEVNSRF
jgi:hypothetical protein